ncbi:hypothetical protein DPMN_154698 [Dreissena polymorpha]|uniref:Uncharacterized protein n=1 Tax=Dreissena polymorpha TaxID=45954 RepID=A0A9D4FKZ6_DREPO|nr:hypothetical protein DPMN_154698 [Dreissena polymorpha]
MCIVCFSAYSYQWRDPRPRGSGQTRLVFGGILKVTAGHRLYGQWSSGDIQRQSCPSASEGGVSVLGNVRRGSPVKIWQMSYGMTAVGNSNPFSTSKDDLCDHQYRRGGRYEDDEETMRKFQKV